MLVADPGYEAAQRLPKLPGILGDGWDQQFLPETVAAVALFGGFGDVGAVELQRTAEVFHHTLGCDGIAGLEQPAEMVYIVPHPGRDAAGGVLQQQIQVIISQLGRVPVLFQAEEKTLDRGVFLVVLDRGNLQTAVKLEPPGPWIQACWRPSS